MTAPGPSGAGESARAEGSMRDEVEAILVRCLEEPEAQWRDAIRRAGERRPDLAPALEARLRAMELLGWFDDAGAASASGSALGRALSRRGPGTAAPGSGESFPEGTRIHHYRVLRELGSGGQATVLLAEDEVLRRNVALKVIHPHLGLDPEMIARFRREAEITSRLSHPGICAVHELRIDGKPACIAMQHVEGETLARKIGRAREGGGVGGVSLFSPAPAARAADPAPPEAGAAPPESDASPPARREVLRVVKLVEEAARALHAAHVAGVIHRDLSPKNIMVTPDRRPVILDFGLATVVLGDQPELTRTGAEIGTPAYMSPEQILGTHRDLDRRTDVFSLAAVLYECLTFRRPFDAATREGLYRMISTREPADARYFNPAIPRDLNVVMSKGLAKERERRYQTALDFAEDLRRVRALEPVLARPTGPGLRLRRWAQRNPGWATAVGGIFLALAIGLSIALAALGQKNAALGERDAAIAESGGFVAAGRLHDLLRRMDEELWPAPAETTPPFAARLREARALAATVETHARRLEDLRARAARREDGRWIFDDPGEQARHDQLAALAADLRDFVSLDPLRPTIRRVEERLARARADRARSVEEPAARARWDACLAALRVSGAGLEPIEGLVPLGPDPDSGLQEFAHLATGTVPERDPATGRLRIAAETGIVFVLLPGGRFTMGRQASDPAARNFDRAAGKGDWPVAEIALDPFLLSKCEMTAWNWARATETRLADARLEDPRFPGRDQELRKPAVSISWSDAAKVLGNLGLALPTEAQWEYACRAGTATRWSTGDDVLSLLGSANIAGEDSTSANPQMPLEAGFRDGFPDRAPVGSLRPNRFGLHDLHGNAGEWCRETWDWKTYELPARPGDGFRDGGDGPNRVLRGGTFHTPASLTHSAYHGGHPAAWRNEDIGVRPSLRITP